MTLDLRDGAPAALSCDVCVVGSGVAGIAIAKELATPGRRVVVLESGGLRHEDETQALYDAVIDGKRFGSALTGRFRVHGGTSTQWGGQALPFTPMDFEPRAWVANSGWPIPYTDVAPYYADAARFLRVDDREFEGPLFAYLGRPRGGFGPDAIRDHFSKWSPVPDLRPRYRTWFESEQSVTLVLHANLTDIRLDASRGRVAKVAARSLGGHGIEITARVFVLCLGGIETARVLLASRSQISHGLGNARDLVGRYFQDHPTTTVGTFRPARNGDFQTLANVSERNGLRYSYRMSASVDLQRRHEILNASAFFDFPSGDALQKLKDAYRLGRRGQWKTSLVRLAQASRHPLAIARPLYTFLRHKRVFTPGDRFPLIVMTEQEPNRESRIVLSPQTDALGMPKAEIRWRLSDPSLRTVQVYTRVLKEELERAGHGTLDVHEWVGHPDTDWPDRLNDMNHHMGTTRMSNDPATGVVDTDLKVHGVENLYLGSCSVFPTGSHSNPTFTMLALCFRLTRHLESLLRRP